MPGMPHPFFWVRRNADTYVPLIPIDELPESVILKDISAAKDWADVCRGEVRFLGDHYGPSGQYQLVESMKPTVENSFPPPTVFRAPDVKDTDQVQAKINNITSSQEQSPEGSQHDSEDDAKYTGNAGTLGKKVYCTYWIRTGNCNYMQEGCKYKHEIPPDDETRLAIGVRTYPTWPREDPTPPPRPAKPEWQKTTDRILSVQAQKPALQQSWRRKTDQSQAVSSGTPKCVKNPNTSPAPAFSSTKASGPSPSAHDSSASPYAPPHLPPHLFPQYRLAISDTKQTTDNVPFASNQQGREQAQNSGFVNGQHAPSVQANNNAASSGSEGYRFGQMQQNQTAGATNPFAFASKGSGITNSSTEENVNSSEPSQYTYTQPAHSNGTLNHHPALFSYENHPNPIPGDAHSNKSLANNVKDTASSSNRVNTPATTNSNFASTLGKPSPFHNTTAHGSNFYSRTASTAGSVCSKDDTKFQNPFSPPLVSPPPIHRRMFCEPGQSEYVANNTEDTQFKPQRPVKKNTNGSPPNKGKAKGLHAGKGFAQGHGHAQARSQAGSIMA